MTEKAEAFWVAAPRRGEIRPEALSSASAGDVRVRALFGAISRGTETLVWSGRVPESLYEPMRAPFQSGSFPAPVKYGYVNVGIIEQGPRDRIGQTVFCLYPHQTRFVVPGVDAVPLPSDVPASRAVLAANMETAVTALWDAPPCLGDRVVVIGAGCVGCLTAYLAAQIPGVSVQLIDVDPSKRAVTRRLGVDFARPDAAKDQADLIFHSSGHPDGLVHALGLAAPEAAIIEMSWYGDRHVTLPLGERFHPERLRIISSQVGRIPPHRRGRWNRRQRLRLALSLLADPVLDVLITGESNFHDLPKTIADLAVDGAGTICHRVRYPDR